ncbi:MAG: menaquinol-cytochrome c reductase iron-sulfur [Planctomycetota bacterium]|nr:MAG: menaquinol-cytochrome c reductase iron-sulfur [Planctomycetota bacterium]
MSEETPQDDGQPTPPPLPPSGEEAPAPENWLVGDPAPESEGPAPAPQDSPEPAPDVSWTAAPPDLPPEPATAPEAMDRRGFLSRASSIAMGAGLVGGYGVFAAMAGRFLYPARPSLKGWLFVIDVASMKPGASLTYTAPDGATIAVARQGLTGQVGDFIALSSTCPHLGCKVHWEGQNQRFFCPCHNGAFDPSGKAIAGPPKEAGQSLGRYPLRIENGLLFIEVPLEGLPGQEEA